MGSKQVQVTPLACVPDKCQATQKDTNPRGNHEPTTITSLHPVTLLTNFALNFAYIKKKKKTEVENGSGKRQKTEVENGSGKRQKTEVENGSGKWQTTEVENGSGKRQKTEVENGSG